MTATGERVKCLCGKAMLTTAGGGRYCENCDVPQPQESAGFERRRTVWDIRFDAEWVQIWNREYKDNTDVGTPNSEEQENNDG